jgi:hypothetical protein
MANGLVASACSRNNSRNPLSSYFFGSENTDWLFTIA